jgi:1-acylglycerone phosphate reductase
MASRRSGLIVNIGSVMGEIPTPWNAWYCAAKAALHSLTETLRSEAAPFGIEVLLVATGAVQSNISANQAKQRGGDEAAYILPEGSLYGDFVDRIVARLHASQAKELSMPTKEFTNILAKRMEVKRPGGFLMAGGGVILFKILNLFPRRLTLWLVAKVWVRKATKPA